MKDYHDIYLIYTRDWENINKDHLKKAIEKTFRKRSFVGDYSTPLKVVKTSELLKSRWIAYQKKYVYAKNIQYNEIINCIEIILEQTLPVVT